MRANDLSTGMKVIPPEKGVGLIGDKSGGGKKDICAFSQKGCLDGCLGTVCSRMDSLASVGVIYREGKISLQGRDIS